MPPQIHLAFRFHGNFYHSYRGDTPDELGFGKDIRIIRHLINTLDELNAQGIPVRGTWDFENYFSLEKIMPAHCPDIIANLQRRAQAGLDEFHLMAYNNGLVNTHTAREFEEVIRRGITNPQGSGLRDLFGDSFYPMVRPQEMMYTPIHLKLYRSCGIESISLFYSALPFNAFSTFVPELTVTERYNPLTLAYPGIAETMTLMPCYNHGDIADHLSLPRWIRAMRRHQMALDAPQDLLLLIDMDADDDFWLGFEVPILNGRFSTIGGLAGLVKSVAEMEDVIFTTPGAYLKEHAPLKTLIIGQDMADGSFDGMSSWAEKWSNQRLWTGLETARILDLQTRRLAGDAIPTETQALLDESFEACLKILSTTHFGMAAPVMNLTRERTAALLVTQAVETAAAAFGRTLQRPDPGCFSLVDYVRGVSTALVQYHPHPSRALVRLPLAQTAPVDPVLRNDQGALVPSAVLNTGVHRELLFIEDIDPAGSREYTLDNGLSEPDVPAVSAGENLLANEMLQIAFDSRGQVVSARLNGLEFARHRLFTSGLTYGRRRFEVADWEDQETLNLGVVALKRMRGGFMLGGGYQVLFEREILLAVGLPYIYVRMRVTYPLTPDYRYDRGKAQRLEQAWDNRWKEVFPCEISSTLAGNPGNSLRVWKHNFCDHVSRYDLDYGRFSKNIELDSANNHVTHGWIAVSDGEKGLLVAQTANVASSMAFCPLRTRQVDGFGRVLLNPFGSYSGKQYHYPTADTGLGRWLAIAFSAADHIQPYAPSFNGREQEFSILIAPYTGDAPPPEVQHDAMAFAYPYLVIPDDQNIAIPSHRAWRADGLGVHPGTQNV